MTDDLDPLLEAVAAQTHEARDEAWVAAVEAALQVHSKATVARVLGVAVPNVTQRLNRTKHRIEERQE